MPRPTITRHNPRFERLLTGEGLQQHSIATTEIQEAIEKLGPEERARLWIWFQKAEEIDELVTAIDEGIQAAEEGRDFSLEEIKMQMQSWITEVILAEPAPDDLREIVE